MASGDESTTADASRQADTGPQHSAGWYGMAIIPAPMRRIIMLYDDGSGARMFFHTADGQLFDGEDGCEYEWLTRDDFCRWTYLPSDYRMWVEDLAEDPMTFPDTGRDGEAR